MKVLIIEDDPAISGLVEYNLKLEKFETKATASAKEGLKLTKSWEPDLVVLDLMLPDGSGLDLCKIIRSSTGKDHISIIMLTAKSEEIDRIVGLEAGADDYITKPFSPRELVLRVKAVLKRSNKKTDRRNIKFKDMIIDFERHTVLIGKKNIELTLTEFNLLVYLLENKERVLNREQILENVWDYSADVFSRTVDTHMTRLREKLGTYGGHIASIRGLGYSWKE